MAEKDKKLQRRYGSSFPEPGDWKNGEKWLKWIDGQRKEQETTLRDKRLHWSRHRHFRIGHQWISTRDGRLWREPSADINDVRIVQNHIGPALDFRLGILAEQRPGFRHEPIGSGVEQREIAEAQQSVAEYYFYVLRAWNVFLDAAYHAQTDGVAFVHVFVDMSQGPIKQNVELVPQADERFNNLLAQGYEPNEDGNIELPKNEEDEELEPGEEPSVIYLGDIGNRIVLAHEVVFDPEARSVNGPVDRAKWAAIRRVRSIESARLETGDDSIEGETMLQSETDVLDMPMDRTAEYTRGLPPFPTGRNRRKDGVFEYLIFISPDPLIKELEKGLWVRVIGNKFIDSGTLPGGLIPLARFTDGSSDTDIFPRPVMSDWIGDQVAINAFLSLLVKHARWFSGGRILAQKNSMLEESYSSIVGSVVEYQGIKPDVFNPVAAGADAWRLLDLMIQKLEDKTGYNDLARGKVSGTGSFQDVSGRALLGARELFERIFGPMVRASAEGATEWARLVVEYAKYLFDEPRMIPVVGGRGDLAKRLNSDSLGDKPMVYADPETMMPLPRAMRQQMLFEMLQSGMISLQTYQKRAPYAEIRNVHMGETDQWDRAQWINTVIEERWQELVGLEPIVLYNGDNIPVLWQDDPAIHKAALQEIVLDERKPWQLRKLTMDRWGIYDQLERAKMNPMIPVPFEVIGVPMDRPILPPQPVAVPGQLPPGTAPEGMGLAAPEMSGSPLPPQETAIPLGEFGAVEQAPPPTTEA